MSRGLFSVRNGLRLATGRPAAPHRFRPVGAPIAVLGHMGAPAVAPANTAESFLAARQLGADGLELDLIALEPGKVVVAHDLGDATGRPDALQLDELSDLLTTPPLAHAPVLIDIKTPGTERALSAAMVGARLAPRSVVSTTDPAVLRALRRAIPGATRSQTFPRSRREPDRNLISRRLARLRQPFTRALMPLIVQRADLRNDLDAITVRHDLVSPALRRLCTARRIELVVWTVDDPAVAEALLDLGVDAIITNDPAAIIPVRDRHPSSRHRIPDPHAGTSVAPPKTTTTA